MRTPGWRAALRLARRDAVRSKWASALVLALLTLPVLAVGATSIAWETAKIDSDEAIDRRIGAAQARVTADAVGGRLVQGVDPDLTTSWDGAGTPETATLEDLEAVLGDRPVVSVRHGEVRFTTDAGVGTLGVTETDPTDPLTQGLFRLVEGRYPAGPDEVAINGAAAERGPAVGETLVALGQEGSERELEVVGIAESTSVRTSPIAVSHSGAFALLEETLQIRRQWLVGGAPVTWDDVLALNDRGLTALSRHVVANPPPESALPQEVRDLGGVDQEWLATLALVVAMVLLEVVLLAGPAFAVSARRQAHTLALIAASGGTPQQARWVVLASGLVFGAAGAVLGFLGALLVGRALVPVLQRFSGDYLGPLDVPWLVVAGVAAFSVVAGLLAAVGPAWLASRMDPVAVLAGRRGDARPSMRSPVIGLALLGGGVITAVLGARGSGSLLIALSAVLSVLGMLFLVPVVVVGLARLASRFPLPMRYAARDAARHRTRTVPAVAAVAATVAGVVALGIATTSDELENRMTYSPSLEMGVAAVSSWAPEADWGRYRDTVLALAPDAEVSEVKGLPSDDGTAFELSATVAGEAVYPSGSGGWLPSVIVADAVPEGLPGLDARDRTRAEAALAAGGAVVWGDHAVDAGRGVLTVRTYDQDEEHTEEQPPGVDKRVPLAVIGYAGTWAPAQAIVSTPTAQAFGLPSTTGALVIRGGLDEKTEADLSEALTAISPEVNLYVERGYEAPDELVILQLILASLGAVLMLGGTLTATFLALSDARPDLATLAAVGASPRTRRGVAAAYALVVGLVGALLGAAVGAIPGIAITYPLTSVTVGSPISSLPDHYLDVPWLLTGSVVLGLPVLTTAIVGLLTRSRLPMTARID